MVGRHEKGAWDSVGCRAKHHESAMGCHGEKGRSDGYSCLCTTVSIRHGMGRGIEGNTKAVEQLASTASYSHGWMDINLAQNASRSGVWDRMD